MLEAARVQLLCGDAFDSSPLLGTVPRRAILASELPRYSSCVAMLFRQHVAFCFLVASCCFLSAPRASLTEVLVRAPRARFLVMLGSAVLVRHYVQFLS